MTSPGRGVNAPVPASDLHPEVTEMARSKQRVTFSSVSTPWMGAEDTKRPCRSERRVCRGARYLLDVMRYEDGRREASAVDESGPRAGILVRAGRGRPSAHSSSRSSGRPKSARASNTAGARPGTTRLERPAREVSHLTLWSSSAASRRPSSSNVCIQNQVERFPGEHHVTRGDRRGDQAGDVVTDETGSARGCGGHPPTPDVHRRSPRSLTSDAGSHPPGPATWTCPSRWVPRSPTSRLSGS